MLGKYKTLELCSSAWCKRVESVECYNAGNILARLEAKNLWLEMSKWHSCLNFIYFLPCAEGQRAVLCWVTVSTRLLLSLQWGSLAVNSSLLECLHESAYLQPGVTLLVSSKAFLQFCYLMNCPQRSKEFCSNNRIF